MLQMSQLLLQVYRGHIAPLLGNLGCPRGQSKGHKILQEGYILPFQMPPNLTRSPTIISCYVNPLRDNYLMEALHAFMTKNAVELVTTKKFLGFYNRLFLIPKPNNWWSPILDLSTLNKFLKTEKFKMETPETITTSLRQGSGSCP